MFHGVEEEGFFFFDNGPKKFPHLRKHDRIPTENLPEALQEFRLTSGVTTAEKNELLFHSLKVKEKNKQNVNFTERCGADDTKKISHRKKRKKTRNNDHSSDGVFDFDIEDDGKFLYEEAKFSATTILSLLGKLLQRVWERTLFQNNWHVDRGSAKPLTFEKDIKGFKWRFEITDKHNRKPFFLPDYIIKLIDVEYETFARLVQYKPREWQTQAYKDVIDFSTGALKRTDSGIFSVPLTRMSELTFATLDEERMTSKSKEKLLVGKSSKDSGMTSETDGPAIVAYRRESKTPQYYIPKPKQDRQHVKEIEKVSPNTFDTVNQRIGVIRNMKPEDEDDVATKLQFSLGSKDCHDKGWIKDPSSFGEHEKKAVYAYIRKRLAEAVAQREQEEIANSKTFVHPEVVVHCYGDAKKKAVSKYQRKGHSNKNSKKNNGVPFMVTLRDGSYTIYYPSGNVAVVNSFVPGYPSNSYIVVYGDSVDNNTILAHFTPVGRGVCYHKNGQISFISTLRYAYCHDEAGALINKWKWTGRKLVPSYTLQLSPNLTFRCSNKDSMSLFVNIDGESTKIRLVKDDASEETLLQQQEQIIPAKKPKRRKGRLRDEAKIEEKISKLSLIKKSSSELQSYQTELHVLHNKFKETVHEWMDHYRIAVGIKPPHSLKGKRKSMTKSAGHRENIQTEKRLTSAPANFRYSLQERGRSPSELMSDDSAICLTKLPFRCGVLRSSGTGLPKKGCPVVCRMKMMGISDTHCRCDRKKIPIITDIEFDSFIMSLPKTQLVVVSVFKERCSNPFDPTLNEIHYQLNKDRSFPCVQSSSDPYRLFRYPIPSNITAAESALLIDRHKVAAGMFIMYLSGKLLFSDYIFDGYGHSKKDFLNQITRTRREALDERYLPDDYQFSPRSRSPSPHHLHKYESGETMQAYHSKSTVTSTLTSKSTIASKSTLTSDDADINRIANSSNEGIHSPTKVSPQTSIRFVEDAPSKANLKSTSCYY